MKPETRNGKLVFCLHFFDMPGFLGFYHAIGFILLKSKLNNKEKQAAVFSCMREGDLAWVFPFLFCCVSFRFLVLCFITSFYGSVVRLIFV